ncbi:MAG: dihydroneopterin triphosphate diphosphatase [Gammaproteobacteria bacterium]|nr:dihydroneopterin triphosphate diphosphatase [Gammaproteobacteria bacterium]
MHIPDGEPYKRPESVLVVVYTATGKVLLLRRVDHADFWQSVTGSMNRDEVDPYHTAIRELREETGIVVNGNLVDLEIANRYEIFPEWRYRYEPGVTHNTEHAFSLKLADICDVVINPAEHSDACWLSFEEATRRLASWTNREVVEYIDRNGL